ncbi:hypothetical protein QTI33_15055 [Variovorax sp. J22P271]|uniref:hypothetical protein n=1 Tax=Variovorax davisae TaxID=3053515 RepID=UPI00257645B0|nr:hypothetical protein [Variovorax sp. J22P271]MDM0033452.1 hypothetical protein [Variovorax sp. J22P271]
MTKLLATALISIVAASMVVYAIQPVDAAVTPQASIGLALSSFTSTDLSMPPPQEPFDNTPITPVETVGAAAYEPY